MNGRSPAFVITSSLLVLGLAGCGGSGAAQTPAHDSSSSAPNSPSAPSVSDPVDITQFTQKPCGLLTNSVASSLGFSGEGKMRNTVGSNEPTKTCSWGSYEQRLEVHVDTVGLSGQYRKQKLAQFYQYFTPTSVGGNPGAYFSLTDDRSKGDWEMEVAANDKQGIIIRVNNDKSPSQAKPALDKAAKAVVSTIKGAK